MGPIFIVTKRCNAANFYENFAHLQGALYKIWIKTFEALTPVAC